MDSTLLKIVAAADAALFLIVAAFQVLLASGRPWGEAAWGGAHPGVLPAPFRIASGFAALIWLVFAAIVLARGQMLPLEVSSALLTPATWVITALLGIGTIMNMISRSRRERLLWTPTSFLGFLFSLALAVWG